MSAAERTSLIEASEPILRADLPYLPWREAGILRLARAFDQSATGFIEQLLARYGLNEGLFHTLMLINSLRDEDVTPSQLCALVAQSPASMTRTLQTLAERGLVVRAPSESDGRKSHVWITAQGQHMVLEILQVIVEPVKQVFSVLSDDEQLQFESLLRKVIVSLDQVTDGIEPAAAGERPRESCLA